jgi:hypothetical protein
MAWLYSQPRSPNILQAAEYYLRQKLAQPTYGYSQHPRQYYQQPAAPQYYQQPAAPQYPQSPVQQFYEQAVPQYYEQPMQQYYQSPAPQYYEQAASQYATLGVGTGNIPRFPQNWNSLFW